MSRREIGALLLSVILFFVIGEAGIRLYLRHKTIYDMEMLRYSMLMKVDSENPLIEYVHKPNTSARLMNVDVRINSDGWRDEEYPAAKTGKYRIIFLGDSLTFGWGVEHKDTFENIIEENLNKRYPAEIINFGTGNYNTEQEVNLFLEKGFKYKPNKVVIFYFINDAETTQKKSRLWFLGYSRLISFYWSKGHFLISNLFSSKGFEGYYSSLYANGSAGWVNAKAAFLQLKDICLKRSIELQVVLLPELHNLEKYPFKKEHGLVEKFLRDNSIECLDLAPFFAGFKNPMELWVAQDDAHPNKKAHN